ncbi:MAG TPA: hypothetical protein VH280_22135 [Verrucomicrobiae bacterium]|jgi:uncharacterized membrane protein YbaN (DUF454 family)|nr:hypothetical protein [Verrucomicrobiae bacterium]
MNNQEAKLILQGYRPNGQDAADPFFAEALEQVRRDPELQKWFNEESVLNSRIQTRLQGAIPVPPNLKSELLALQKTVLPTPWWLQPMKLAAVALVLTSLGAILLMIPQKTTQLASFRETMVRSSLQTQEHVSFQSHDIAGIQQWLRSKNMDAHFDLPAALQAGAGTAQGCRVVDWNGHQATMICFIVNGEHMDLFVMDGAGLPNLGGTPQFASADGIMTATWTGNGKVYLLAGKNQTVLEKILQRT